MNALITREKHRKPDCHPETFFHDEMYVQRLEMTPVVTRAANSKSPGFQVRCIRD